MSEKDELKYLDLSSIEANPNQPRKHFPRRQLDDLKESIKASGLLQPIVVRPLVQEGRYQIVAGERRFRAYTELAIEENRFKTIPAVVKVIGDDEMAVASLVENIIRDDLNPIERAEAMKTLKAQLQTSWEGVARRVGLSKRAVLFLLGTLKLRPEIRKAIEEKTLEARHSRAFALLSHNPDAQYDLFEYVKEKKLKSEDAIVLATVMRKYSGMTAEEATSYIERKDPKDKLPSPRMGLLATPFLQVVRGLKTFLNEKEGAPSVDTNGLTEEEKKVLHPLLQQARERIDLLLKAL